MLQDTKNSGRVHATPYAVRNDFCRLFSEEMSSLFLLALLLTSDAKTAEQCFAAALEDCLKANDVFKDWTRTWARRAIVQNAISMMHLAPEHTTESANRLPAMRDVTAPDSGWPFATVMQLPAFQRIVFVLSVLESYPDQECKVLLDCTRLDVVEARTRALELIGEAAIARDHRGRAVQAGLTFIPPERSDQFSNLAGSVPLTDGSGLIGR